MKVEIYEEDFYLGYYNLPDSGTNFVLAAVNKMNYICEAVEKAGYSTEIVSASGAVEKKFCKSKKVKLTDKTTLKLFSSLPRLNRIVSVIDRVILKTSCFYIWLRIQTKTVRLWFTIRSVICLS